MQRSTQLRPDPDVVAQRLEDEIVLVQLRTNRIYELNRTGARIWELWLSGCDAAQIEHRMLEEFEVDRARLAEEIEALFRSLAREELVHCVDGS